jgi:hypothetical protein
LDDPDDSDEPKGRDKGNMDGWRMDKEKAKKRAEEAILRDQIAKMMKSMEALMMKQLEAKIGIAEKKHKLNEEK